MKRASSRASATTSVVEGQRTRRSLLSHCYLRQSRHYLRIELASRSARELPDGFLWRATSPVGSAVNHHIIGICGGHYSRRERYLLCLEPVGVAATVVALVVVPDHLCDPAKAPYLLDHSRSDIWVTLDELPLLLR